MLDSNKIHHPYSSNRSNKNLSKPLSILHSHSFPVSFMHKLTIFLNLYLKPITKPKHHYP